MISLPTIPPTKRYVDKMTLEQKILAKCINHIDLNVNEEKALKECIQFYKTVFPLLKSIQLSNLQDEQVNTLKEYLNNVFSIEITVTNAIDFDLLFRVSIISDDFLEKDKVRNPGYLTYPPLELVKKKQQYNRANSYNKTVLYASFYEHVALRETKPKVGDRIIISKWKNISKKPFNSYAIAYSDVNNEGVSKATKSLHELKGKVHPLFEEIMKLILAFLASEFVKDTQFKNPKKYEYLYSAYFSDKILSLYSDETPEAKIDFLLYPSVAWKHVHDNVAIPPEIVNEKLKLFEAKEFIVKSTYYDKELNLNETPVELELLRESDWIETDLIIWNDD